MQTLSRFSATALLAFFSALVQAQTTQLTIDAPACRSFPGATLPEKYIKLAKSDRGYAWLSKTTPGDAQVSGNGRERVDGSEMYNWLAFYRTDIDNDGYCDWYLDAGAPLSTGGDRDSIDTLYLGRKDGWLRIGARVPANKPDELGVGNTTAEQMQFLFGEEIGVIHDAKAKTNYLVSAFYDRHVRRNSMPGYRIQVWDAGKKTLRKLDKWEPNSKAAEVYAFFKTHGAHLPAAKNAVPEDTVLRFDADIEAYEIRQACNADSPQRSAPDVYGAVSRYLLARCKR